MKRTNCNSYVTKCMVAVCATCAFLTVSATAAQTKLLKFDNVTTNFQVSIQNYGGLIWSNFGVVNGVEYIDSGYQNAVISSNYVAFPFGDSNTPLSASVKSKAGHFFRLNSGYFTAAWNDDLQLQVIGRHGSRVMFDKTYVLSSTAPTKITFPPAVLTSVQFNSSGGTYNTNYVSGTGEHFAIDNLNVSEQ